MAATKGQPWDDWWDNLASRGNWTVPPSRASHIAEPQANASESGSPLRPGTRTGPPDRVSVPWREIEELHTMVSELDRERRRLADNLDLAQKAMAESTQLRASLEFLEGENLSLRQQLMLVERERT